MINQDNLNSDNLNRDLLKLQIAILMISNARRLGWKTEIIKNKIYIRKKKTMMTELDKNPEYLVMVLAQYANILC